MTKISVFVEDGDEMNIKKIDKFDESSLEELFYIDFGGTTVYLSDKQLEKLYKNIEQQLWSKEHHADNLEMQVEKLEYEVRQLEEELEFFREREAS